MSEPNFPIISAAAFSAPSKTFEYRPQPEIRQRVQDCEGGRKMRVTEYVVDYAQVQWGDRGRATHPDVPADFDFHSATLRSTGHVAVFSKVEALP